ncbi:MAG: hypothetical protein K2N15_12600 [Lachnospiraceae bacterium]|nr:hypothetical protein [Lachnospiraceae bacterium]
MAKTSFHLEACDLATSEIHNKREKELDYVRKDLSHLNESFMYIDHSLQKELSNIKKEVKLKTDRKLQKNAVAIKEGVLVIKEDTSIEDIKKFCLRCQELYGIIPLQAYTHKDEGHWKEGKWIPNYHAHIIFRMYTTEGKNARIKDIHCSEMQTIAAEILGMERGKSSTKKHLSSLQYKIEKETEKLEQIERDIEGRTMVKERLEGAKQGISDLFTGKARQKYIEAEKRAEKAEKQAQESISRAKYVVEQAAVMIESEKARADRIEKEWIQHSEEIKEIETFRAEQKAMRSLLVDAADMGLTAAQTLRLSNEKQIQVENLLDKAGNKISRADGQPIRIKLDKDGIKAWFVCTWEKAWTWVREVVNNPHFLTNGIPNDKRHSKGISR